MDGNQPTQKKIAGKYAGNPGYFRRAHYLRTIRGWSFFVVAVCSVAAVVGFRFWGRNDIFSKGAISEKHAPFASDCRACHVDAQTDLLKARLSESPGARSVPAIFTSTLADQSAGGQHPHGGSAGPADSPMDLACIKCHPGFDLHLPQAAGLALRPVATDLAVVHATRCYACHREHVGGGRMALPDRRTCASCHGDAGKLRESLVSLPLGGRAVAANGENRDLGDHLVRFIAPARAPGSLPPFAQYADGHPPFAHEKPGLRDPAELKFNHARHARADIVAMGPDKKLGCADCHQPGAGGAFYQPVNYERHCQQCHSLQITPALPELRIPHGDPEKVRYFLASVNVAIERALRAGGMENREEIQKRTQEEMEALRRRGLITLDQIEKRVFLEGDPPVAADQRRMRSGNSKFLTECAKCHTVVPGESGRAPVVQPPNVAERWIQRGPFTHLPHQHMVCTDCHGAAVTSKLTSDILLPSQKICAECHRPPGAHGDAAPAAGPEAAGSGGSAAAQRASGGVKWDCQSCHQFHAPAGTQDPVKLRRPAAR